MSQMFYPALVQETSVASYIKNVMRFPMLTAEEEYALSKKFQAEGDLASAHKLVTSHLRLVVKIAQGYTGYNLPFSELVSEGTIGLMQAVKKFNPDKGFRLATYAIWWIKAFIQEFVLKSWSLVKIGTTLAQKKLFFNLKKIKKQIQKLDNGSLSPTEAKLIAKELSVSYDEVVEMDKRLQGADQSLNALITDDSVQERQDLLVDETTNQETLIAEKQELGIRSALLSEALTVLNEREKEILIARRLSENQQTLEELSIKHGISRERIRQIETKAFEKLQQYMLPKTTSVNLLTRKE